MHCREILFTPRCSSKAREFPRSVNVFAWRTVAELWGVKFAQFSDFGLFSPYKTPNTYLPVTSLQPRGYIAEWLRFFHVIVEGRKGACRPRCFSATSGRGAGDPQTCPNFRLWQMAIPMQNATTRRVRSGPKMSEKGRDSFQPPFFPKLADRAQNYLNVFTLWYVHVYRIWSGSAAFCRTYSEKIDFSAHKVITI